MSSTREKNVVNSEEARERPFDPVVIEQAEALASRYQIRIKRDQHGYTGTVPELPSVFGHGTSRTAARATTRDLAKWAIAYLIETGRTPVPRS